MDTIHQEGKSHAFGRAHVARVETHNKERRKESRGTTHALQKTWVEIPLSFAKGARIVEEVMDLHEGGLSFKMAQEVGFLLPGTVIKHLTIHYKNRRIEKPAAEVMYVTPLQESSDFKIGLQFLSHSSKRSALGRGSMAHALRPIRHTLSGLGPQQKSVRFTSPSGLHASGVLKNISDYGLAFEFEMESHPGMLSLEVGETLDSVEVRVYDDVIYQGGATIASLRSEQNKTTVGASFGERCEALHHVVERYHETDSDDEISLFSKLERIDTAFKAQVADLRYVLEAVRKAMDEEEERADRHGRVYRDKAEKTVLRRFQRPVFNDLDEAMKAFNVLVSPLDAQAHASHRDYFQKQLAPLLCHSPFIERAYNKPLGYAGDYEMMNMLYRDATEGDSFFGRLLNRYFCHHISPASACRNRIPVLLKKMEQVAEEGHRQGKKRRILSVACGPANEAIEFIKKNEASNHTELTFVDIEPEALYTTQAALLDAKKRHQRHTTVHVYSLPLKRLFVRPNDRLHLNHQDLIYCVGLFDYLTDTTARRAIASLYRMLNPDGTLVVGNFDPRNTFRACMEYCMEWHLIYRTQADLIRLAREVLESAPTVFCEAEPTGINNFLIVKK